jgi:hypothetical protein
VVLRGGVGGAVCEDTGENFVNLGIQLDFPLPCLKALNHEKSLSQSQSALM